MKYTTVFGEEIETSCIGCTVANNKQFMKGRIYRTKLWNLAQDFEIAYPGMIILSPLRHVSNYIDLTLDEQQELNVLLSHCKKAIINIFNCKKVAYAFYEKPDGHIHFIVIPLHNLVDIGDKYSVLGELMTKAEMLRNNKENMVRVVDAISKLKNYFNNL